MQQPAATISADSLNALKASLLDHVLQQLEAMGFGTNDPINGGDCVESVDMLYQHLRRRIPKVNASSHAGAQQGAVVLDGSMSLTVTVDLQRKPEPFQSEAAAVEWVQSCLNRNVNHVVAAVRLVA